MNERVCMRKFKLVKLSIKIKVLNEPIANSLCGIECAQNNKSAAFPRDEKKRRPPFDPKLKRALECCNRKKCCISSISLLTRHITHKALALTITVMQTTIEFAIIKFQYTFPFNWSHSFAASQPISLLISAHFSNILPILLINQSHKANVLRTPRTSWNIIQVVSLECVCFISYHSLFCAPLKCYSACRFMYA